jgi:diadenosine tetraphosphate (Ap4A) HIT family hydrolase
MSGGIAATSAAGCPLCESDGGVLLWRDDYLHIVDAQEPDYPGFCRVIWNAHVAELSDLDEPSRARLMRAVLVVERLLRRVMAPAKINLASLGNQVPHLHWHVIPRYADDAQFPAPVWAPRQREVAPAILAARQQLATGIADAIAAEWEKTAGASSV